MGCGDTQEIPIVHDSQGEKWRRDVVSAVSPEAMELLHRDPGQVPTRHYKMGPRYKRTKDLSVLWYNFANLRHLFNPIITTMHAVQNVYTLCLRLNYIICNMVIFPDTPLSMSMLHLASSLLIATSVGLWGTVTQKTPTGWSQGPRQQWTRQHPQETNGGMTTEGVLVGLWAYGSQVLVLSLLNELQHAHSVHSQVNNSSYCHLES